MKFSLRTLLVAVTVCAVLALIGSATVSLNNLLRYGIDDAYAQWGTADMLVDYMRANNEVWPRDWEDLRPHFTASQARCGGWDFEKLKSRITVDFDVDIEQLRKSAETTDHPEFDVINARYSSTEWGSGPDYQIWSYLRKDSSQPLAISKPPQ